MDVVGSSTSTAGAVVLKLLKSLLEPEGLLPPLFLISFKTLQLDKTNQNPAVNEVSKGSFQVPSPCSADQYKVGLKFTIKNLG